MLICIIDITVLLGVLLLVCRLEKRNFKLEKIIRKTEQELKNIANGLSQLHNSGECCENAITFMDKITFLFEMIHPGNRMHFRIIHFNKTDENYVNSYDLKEIIESGKQVDSEIIKYFNIYENNSLNLILKENYSKIILCDLKKSSQLLGKDSSILSCAQAYISLPIQRKHNAKNGSEKSCMRGCYSIYFEKPLYPLIDLKRIYPILEDMSDYFYRFIIEYNRHEEAGIRVSYKIEE